MAAMNFTVYYPKLKSTTGSMNSCRDERAEGDYIKFAGWTINANFKEVLGLGLDHAAKKSWANYPARVPEMLKRPLLVRQDRDKVLHNPDKQFTDGFICNRCGPRLRTDTDFIMVAGLPSDFYLGKVLIWLTCYQTCIKTATSVNCKHF